MNKIKYFGYCSEVKKSRKIDFVFILIFEYFCESKIKQQYRFSTVSIESASLTQSDGNQR